MYRWEESPKQFELWIDDETVEAVFREAAVALGDLLTEERGGAPANLQVSLVASDPAQLLRDWLAELVKLAEKDGFIPERVRQIEVAGSAVEAVVGGQRSDPKTIANHVSCRKLDLDSTDGAWHAHLLLAR